jgi:hypothetical protein
MPDGQPPRQPPLLGIVRFGMEIVAFGGLFWWGWSIADGGVAGLVLGTAFFLIAALLWGAFAVVNDPSRNPNPPIGVPGWVRLVIELGIFGVAAWGIWASGARWLSESLLTLVVLTYALAYDRLIWLLRQRDFRGLGKTAEKETPA